MCPAIYAKDIGVLKKQWQGSKQRIIFVCFIFIILIHMPFAMYIFILNLSGYLVTKWTLIEFITSGKDHCMHTA